jgi:hypothetical protein
MDLLPNLQQQQKQQSQQQQQQQCHQPPAKALEIPGPLVQRQVRGGLLLGHCAVQQSSVFTASKLEFYTEVASWLNLCCAMLLLFNRCCCCLRVHKTRPWCMQPADTPVQSLPVHYNQLRMFSCAALWLCVCRCCCGLRVRSTCCWCMQPTGGPVQSVSVHYNPLRMFPCAALWLCICRCCCGLRVPSKCRWCMQPAGGPVPPLTATCQTGHCPFGLAWQKDTWSCLGRFKW